jgi:hypothetical protein
MTGSLRRVVFAGLTALTLASGMAATVEPASAWYRHYWVHRYWAPGYCGVRRVWVPGPFGWHWVWARRCW